jgi:hypothetical protein
MNLTHHLVLACLSTTWLWEGIFIQMGAHEFQMLPLFLFISNGVVVFMPPPISFHFEWGWWLLSFPSVSKGAA